MPHSSREIHLVRRPEGAATPDDFELVTSEVRDPREGELLVRNRWMSVDPAMRPRMDDRPSYAPPYQIGAAPDGGAIGEVLVSHDPRYSPGDLVRHRLGWRELAVIKADLALPVDPTLAPEQAFLGILGMPGLTAYAGLVALGRVEPGDVVFVSAAAGAVGSAVGQMARLLGASTVIGSAGGPAKVAHLTDDLGFDAAIDYRSQNVREELGKLAPDGIDIYFDNVGGEQLEAALDHLALHARIVVCGMIAQYQSAEPPVGPRNLVNLIIKRASMHGLLVVDHVDLRSEFLRNASTWLADGELHYRETVVDGLENAPHALIDMLSGHNVGKMLVRLTDNKS